MLCMLCERRIVHNCSSHAHHHLRVMFLFTSSSSTSVSFVFWTLWMAKEILSIEVDALKQVSNWLIWIDAFYGYFCTYHHPRLNWNIMFAIWPKMVAQAHLYEYIKSTEGLGKWMRMKKHLDDRYNGNRMQHNFGAYWNGQWPHRIAHTFLEHILLLFLIFRWYR